jgi:hypothetical protein
MMTTLALDGNDDARWRMTPEQWQSTMMYCLVVRSMPHPHLGRHSRDINYLQRWDHSIDDDNDHPNDHGR